MRFQALATDYDGTLAADGTVSDEIWTVVDQFRKSGRKLILVTGRVVEDLRRACPNLERFDYVVAENGGVLFLPSTGEVRLLAPPPSPELIEALKSRGVAHIEVGATIVATVQPFEAIALDVIRELGHELTVVFNKGAVMLLSPGVNKASGLKAALEELGLSPHNVVGIGDAENDHAFLEICECAVAVANALPLLKKHADFVTSQQSGRGVVDVMKSMMQDDLISREHELKRHHIQLGTRKAPDQREERFSPYGTVAMIAGSSGGGKTTLTFRLLERLVEMGYQFCGFDPEGDYDTFEGAVILGSPHHPPAPDEVLRLLREPKQNVIFNLVKIPLHERPEFCAALLTRLTELRVRTGRPHWLILDEAHHLFPLNWDSAPTYLPQKLETALLITVHPDELAPAIVKDVNLMMAVGETPAETLNEFARSSGLDPVQSVPQQLEKREALVWRVKDHREKPFVVEMRPGHTEHRRHIRKYAEGSLIPERSFYFRGPEAKLNLRAHNLMQFLELAEGVDDETWLYHLNQHEYSEWFREMIKDEELSEEAKLIEDQKGIPAKESRQSIRALIETRYTLPANPSLPKAAQPKT